MLLNTGTAWSHYPLMIDKNRLVFSVKDDGEGIPKIPGENI